MVFFLQFNQRHTKQKLREDHLSSELDSIVCHCATTSVGHIVRAGEKEGMTVAGETVEQLPAITKLYVNEEWT